MGFKKTPLQTKDFATRSGWRERPKRTQREVSKHTRRAQQVFAELVKLEEGYSYDLLLNPGIGLLSVVIAIAKRHGPLDLEALVFSFSQAAIEVLVGEPSVGKMRLHIDTSIPRRSVSGTALAFRVADCRLVESHAKVTLLFDDERELGFVLTGSANLTKNRGYEQLTILRSHAATLEWREEIRRIPTYERKR